MLEENDVAFSRHYPESGFEPSSVNIRSCPYIYIGSSP